jgi:hypothetical protein
MTRGVAGLLLMMVVLPIGLVLAAGVVEGANDGLTAHELLLFIHQLLFVYWLGPDMGVYYLSGRMTDPALTVGQRLAAAQTMGQIDLVPRICMSLMLTVGGILSEFVGVPHPAWQMAGIVLLGPVWLTVVLVIYFKQGTALGATLTRLDFWFRAGLILAILASVSYSWNAERLADTPWVAGKLVLFAAILLFGLLMRVAVKPLIAGIGQLATVGPSDTVNASMAASLARTKPWVLALWACLFLEAWLGVFQPGGVAT